MLPNNSNAYLIITEQTTLLKKVARKVGFVSLFCRPITLKHFNSLTTIKTPSCLGGLELTHRSSMPVLISGSDMVFVFVFLFCYCCDF